MSLNYLLFFPFGFGECSEFCQHWGMLNTIYSIYHRLQLRRRSNSPIFEFSCIHYDISSFLNLLTLSAPFTSEFSILFLPFSTTMRFIIQFSVDSISVYLPARYSWLNDSSGPASDPKDVRSSGKGASQPPQPSKKRRGSHRRVSFTRQDANAGEEDMEDNHGNRRDEHSDETLHHERDREPKEGKSQLEEAEKAITDTGGRASRISAMTLEPGKCTNTATWTYRVTQLSQWPC